MRGVICQLWLFNESTHYRYKPVLHTTYLREFFCGGVPNMIPEHVGGYISHVQPRTTRMGATRALRGVNGRLSRGRRYQHRSGAHQLVAECGTHTRRDALQATVQADSSLANRAARTVEGGGGTGDAALCRLGLWYRWNQNSLRLGCSQSDISLEDLQQRFQTGKKVQPQRAGAHTHPGLNADVLY